MYKDCLTFLVMTLCFFIPHVSYASVAGEVNKANELYKQGKFDDSLDLYQKAVKRNDKSPIVKYDLGTALYKKGEYSKALGYLEQAAQDKNIKLRPKAEYNLGNVLYKSGMQKENTNVDEAIKSLQEALGHYGEAINVDPKDQDASFNQDFVKKEIERLEQKKEQQEQKNQQNQQDKQNKQNRQNQQDQQEQQDQQSKQNQQNKENQQDQQGKQDQQKQQENRSSQQINPQDQKNQSSNPESQAQKQQNARAQAEENQKELDRKQAENLLEDYQENEEPKKLLNYMPKKIDDRPVLKDW